MADEPFLEHVPEPVVALEDDWTIHGLNERARDLLGVDDWVVGEEMGALLPTDEDLRTRYGDLIAHYPDVGGVLEAGRRHFDPDHPTIQALEAGEDPRSSDPDIGIVTDGDIVYYHITVATLGELPGAASRVVVFRDITPVKEREQDLDFLMQVLTRILRHNLRNDITVIRGYAATIAEEGTDTEAEMADTILEMCEDLVATSEKARLIETVVDTDDRVGHDLQAIIEDCVATVAGENPEASIRTDVPDLAVEAHPNLPRALEDTIENAVIYNDSEVPEVDISAQRDEPWARIEVADNGPGIPETELDALVHRGETDLVHGSGAGLWLTYTVVQESGGDISYDTEDGTTVSMQLPLAE